MLRKLLLAGLFFVVLSTGGLFAERLRVLATFDIPADWVKQVAGDKVELIVLAGPGQDIHAFEPAPRQLATLSNVQLVVEIGAGLEYWLDDMLESAEFNGQRLSLSDAVTLHEAGESHDDHEHGPECNHAQDPHVWMDPVRVQQMCAYLAETLAKMDPDNALAYRENSQRWAAQLDALDQQAEHSFAKIPLAKRKIITYHQNLGYFAERYDIAIPATVLGSITTEGGDPSARQLAQLIRLIKQDNITAVFADTTSSPRLAQQLCREAKLPTPKVLYVESFANNANGPQDYEAMFRYNVATIVDALATPPHDGSPE